MKLSRSAGGIVINRSTGKILIVSQNGDSWSLPKGHVEPGEDDLTTARREITEESGVTELELIQKLGEYDRHPIARGGGERTDEMKSIVVFLFTTSQEDLAPTDPANPEARWLPREDVAKMLTHPRDAAFFLASLPQLPQ